MRGINKVTLIGHLGADPEVRYLEDGTCVANVNIATTESYKNKETGEKVVMPTDWHNISVRRPGLVKVVENYVKKGQLLYVEGKLRTRTYEKDGDTKYITEVVVDEFTMLGSKADSDLSAPQAVSQPQTAKAPQQPVETKPKLEEPTPEDDLPF